MWEEFLPHPSYGCDFLRYVAVDFTLYLAGSNTLSMAGKGNFPLVTLPKMNIEDSDLG